jgi:hypothetical protein
MSQRDERGYQLLIGTALLFFGLLYVLTRL